MMLRAKAAGNEPLERGAAERPGERLPQRGAVRQELRAKAAENEPLERGAAERPGERLPQRGAVRQ